MNKKILFGFFLFLFLINFISAAPPFETQSFPEGLDLILNQQNILALDSNYTLRVHVYNHSTGAKIDNTSTTCDLHFNGVFGEVELFTDLEYNLTTEEFFLFIDQGNITEIGTHPWIIECQFDDGGEVYGGFIEGLLEINPTGIELTTARSILLFGQMLLLILIAFGFMYIGMELESAPFKILFLGLSALFTITAIGFSVSLQNIILVSSSEFFSRLYILFTTLILGGFLGILVFLIAKVIIMFKKSRGWFKDDDDF